MRRRVLPILVLIVVLAAAAGAYLVYRSRTANQQQTLGGSGTVEADQVVVSPLVGGRLTKVSAVEGNAVKQGEVLFQLDSAIAKDQVSQAQAGVRAAKAAYDQVKGDSSSKDSDIEAAKARLQQARIAVQMAQVQVTYYTVTAPLSAAVQNVTVEPGEVVTPGETLALLGDVSTLKVSIYIPETQIGQVRIGQAGDITTDSLGRTFHGKVTFIATQAEFTPTSVETKDQRAKLVYEVRLEVTDSSGELKPGMPVDVTLR